MDERRLQPGDRVLLAGRVVHERSGFVTVRWDSGTESTVRVIDLRIVHDAPPSKRLHSNEED